MNSRPSTCRPIRCIRRCSIQISKKRSRWACRHGRVCHGTAAAEEVNADVSRVMDSIAVQHRGGSGAGWSATLCCWRRRWSACFGCGMLCSRSCRHSQSIADWEAWREDVRTTANEPGTGRAARSEERRATCTGADARLSSWCRWSGATFFTFDPVLDHGLVCNRCAWR